MGFAFSIPICYLQKLKTNMYDTGAIVFLTKWNLKCEYHCSSRSLDTAPWLINKNVLRYWSLHMVQILTNKICVKLSTMHLMWLLSHKYVPSSINKLENLMGLIWTHTDRCTITINGNGNAKLLWYMYKYTRSYMNCHFISTFMNTSLRHLVLAGVMLFPGKFQ